METPPQKRNRASNLLTSLRHALEGLFYSLGTQRNMRLHFILAWIVIMVGATLGLNRLELSILVLAVTFVILAEVLNTAIENAVDITTRRRIHPLAKVSKDLAAAAVLIAAMGAVAVGALLLLPKLMIFMGRFF